MLYLCQFMYGSHGSPMSLQASVYHFSSHLILGEPHDIPMNCWPLYYTYIYIYTSTHMFDQFYLIYIYIHKAISRISMYVSWLLLLKPPRCPTKTHGRHGDRPSTDPLLHGSAEHGTLSGRLSLPQATYIGPAAKSIVFWWFMIVIYERHSYH